MEHLPKVKDPVRQLPSVHYFEESRFSYTGPNLKDFPASVQTLLPPISSPKYRQQYSAFVQQWLYFGPLHDILSIYEIPLDQSDFVRPTQDGRKLLNSEYLPEYIAAWVIQEDKDNPNCLRGAHNSFLPTQGAQLERVYGRMRKVETTLVGLQEALERDVRADDVEPAVWDSIVVLGATLAKPAEAIFGRFKDMMQYRMMRMASFAHFELKCAPTVLTCEDWCPRERKILAELLGHGPCECIFLGQLHRHESKGLHQRSGCDVNVCKAHQIDQSQYVTRHWPADSDCHCEFVGVESASIESINDANEGKSSISKLREKLPGEFKLVTALRLRGQTVEQIEIPLISALATGKMSMPLDSSNLVAISHVWVCLCCTHTNTMCNVADRRYCRLMGSATQTITHCHFASYSGSSRLLMPSFRRSIGRFRFGWTR